MTPIRTLGESWTLRQLGIKGNKGAIALDHYLAGQPNPDLLREGQTFCEMVDSMLSRGAQETKKGSEPKVRTALWRQDDNRKLFETTGLDITEIDVLLAEANKIFALLLERDSKKPDAKAIEKVRETVNKL